MAAPVPPIPSMSIRRQRYEYYLYYYLYFYRGMNPIFKDTKCALCGKPYVENTEVGMKTVGGKMKWWHVDKCWQAPPPRYKKKMWWAKPPQIRAKNK